MIAFPSPIAGAAGIADAIGYLWHCDGGGGGNGDDGFGADDG